MEKDRDTWEPRQRTKEILPTHTRARPQQKSTMEFEDELIVASPTKRQRLVDNLADVSFTERQHHQKSLLQDHQEYPIHSPRSTWIDLMLTETMANDDYDTTISMEEDSERTTIAKDVSSLRDELLHIKQRMDEYYKGVSWEVYRDIRSWCDPYAQLGEKQYHGGLNRSFVNRSAMKLANLDFVTDFGLSSAGADLFVDLCGAPGGFGEYLLWRNNNTRGYGMSLVGSNEQGKGLEWKLKSRGDGESYQIVDGVDGTGDVCNWDNVEFLKARIQNDLALHDTAFAGVGLVVADGGTDAQRNSEFQEQISLKLFVCQVAAGLHLLREGGSLVVKAFGFATETSCAVLMDLVYMFESVRLVKPVTSRPASAERYIVAEGFKGKDVEWDGRKWLSWMLLAKPTAARSSDIKGFLCHQIDLFEGQLVSLNVDACRSMLDKLMTHQDDNRMGMHWEEGEKERRLHVFAYKRAWKLF